MLYGQRICYLSLLSVFQLNADHWYHSMCNHSCCGRNLHLAHIRMWAGDYTLSGLVGFELRCKTVGLIGTGAIGAAAARIFCVSTPSSGSHYHLGTSVFQGVMESI